MAPRRGSVPSANSPDANATAQPNGAACSIRCPNHHGGCSGADLDRHIAPAGGNAHRHAAPSASHADSHATARPGYTNAPTRANPGAMARTGCALCEKPGHHPR